MRGSLSSKVIYSFVVLISLMLIGMVAGASILIRDYFIFTKKQELTAKAFEVARISDDYYQGRISEEQFAGILKSIDALMDTRVWVVDRASQMVYMSLSHRDQSNNDAVERSPTSFVLWDVVDELVNDIDAVFEGKVWSKSYYHPYYREDMLMVAVPLEGSTGITGAVMLSAPAKGINAFLREIYYYIAIASLLALALAVALAHWLARGIVVPLKAMRQTAVNMARGDYETRVQIHSSDELGDLGLSLNTLARELAEYVERAEQVEKMRRDFVANVSHELRTPLTVIRGYTEALLDGTVADQVLAERYHRIVRDETVRLERMIKDLLDLSRLQAGNRSFEQEEIPLPSLVESVVAMLAQRADQQGVELVYTGEAVPMIAGNGDQLIQLILILLDNALKFTPSHGSVVVTTTKQDDQVVLSVKDTGVGIPVEDLPHIWERFYKVDKAHSRTQPGTGLGLAIAKEIIDLHGATVYVCSEPGCGTEYVICFPIAR